MKVSSVNSSGRALPDAAGAETVADATGVSATTDVATAEERTAEERTVDAGAVGVAMTVLLDTADVAGVELPEPAPQVATGPPGAV